LAVGVIIGLMIPASKPKEKTQDKNE
jgi:hypothetical protein